MNAPIEQPSRIATILAALLYLLTVYQRTRCPRIAACIAAHFDCLAEHPCTDDTIRSVCAGMREEWRVTAQRAQPRSNLH